MNLTLALSLPGDTSAPELPAPGLPGAEGAAENGAIAGFAGLLAGLTVPVSIEGDAAPVPELEQASSEATPTGVPMLPDLLSANGKVLPSQTGKNLPDLPQDASAPAVIPGKPLTLERRSAALPKAIAEDVQAQAKAPPEQPASARPVQVQPSVEPLQLQLAVRALNPGHKTLKDAAKPSPVIAETSDAPAAPPITTSGKVPKAGKVPAASGAPTPISPASQSSAELPSVQPVQAQQHAAQPSAATTAGQLSIATPVLTPETSAPAVRAAPNAQPQDFEAIVGRLADARENARSADTSLRVLTREFGQVAMQFEIAGRALKVSLASQDVAFAPAVQAALAERGPLVVSETVRSEAMPGRGESNQHSGQASQHSGQTTGSQNSGPNSNQGGSQSASTKSNQTNSPQPQADGKSDASTRDHGLFA